MGTTALQTFYSPIVGAEALQPFYLTLQPCRHLTTYYCGYYSLADHFAHLLLWVMQSCRRFSHLFWVCIISKQTAFSSEISTKHAHCFLHCSLADLLLTYFGYCSLAAILLTYFGNCSLAAILLTIFWVCIIFKQTSFSSGCSTIHSHCFGDCSLADPLLTYFGCCSLAAILLTYFGCCSLADLLLAYCSLADPPTALRTAEFSLFLAPVVRQTVDAGVKHADPWVAGRWWAGKGCNENVIIKYE